MQSPKTIFCGNTCFDIGFQSSMHPSYHRSVSILQIADGSISIAQKVRKKTPSCICMFVCKKVLKECILQQISCVYRLSMM